MRLTRLQVLAPPKKRQVLAPTKILVLALLLGHRLPRVERRVSLLKGSRLVFLHLATFLRLGLPASDPSPGRIVIPAIIGVAEFLEPTGTIISTIEAESLDGLLREALAFLPAQRMSLMDLAKHHWFRDNYEDMIQKGILPPVAVP